MRGEVTMVANPESVCSDERRLPYLNFDLIVRNGTTSRLRVREVRALVIDGQGEMLERRVAAQQALELIGPGRTVAEGKEGLLYNRFTFLSVQPGSRVRYEVEFMETGVAAVALTVTPIPCLPLTRLVLPLTGRLVVTDGHDVLSHHRRFPYVEPGLRRLGFVDNPYRFALDVVVVDAEGRTYHGDGRELAGEGGRQGTGRPGDGGSRQLRGIAGATSALRVAKRLGLLWGSRASRVLPQRDGGRHR